MPKTTKPVGKPDRTLTAAMPTLHEAPDTCAITVTPVTTGTIVGIERWDTAAITAIPTGKAVLPIVEARDSAQILGTVSLLMTGSIAAVETADSCSIGLTNPSQPSDFATRRIGSTRWHKFNTGTDAASLATVDTFPINGFDALGGQLVSAFNQYSYGWQNPFGGSPYFAIPATLDPAQKPSGSASCKITFAAGPNPATPGFFVYSFGPTCNVGFGQGEQFFIQWRMRWDSNYMTTPLDPFAHIKQIYITEGGRGQNPSVDTGAHDPNSMQIILATFFNERMPQMFGDDPNGGSQGMWADAGGGDAWFQDQMPGCTHSATAGYPGVTPPPQCYPFFGNEFVTFMVNVDLRTATQVPAYPTYWPTPTPRYVWAGGIIRLWMARNNQPEVLLHVWGPGTPGYVPFDAGELPGLKFGKFWCAQHLTGKSATQVHPACSAWYDEIIVSPNYITFPSGNITPAWRSGLPKDQLRTIANTANMAVAVTNGYHQSLSVWNGLAASSDSFYSILASGDGEFPNGAHKINLSVDAPQWQTLDQGTVYCAPTYSGGSTFPIYPGPPYPYTGSGINQQYYWDGRPAGTHTGYSTFYISSAHDKFGRNRIMRFGSLFPGGMYAPAPPPAPQYNQLTVDGFDLSTNSYDPAGTWTPLPSLLTATTYRASCKHPTTEDVYISFDGHLYKWTPLLDSYSAVTTIPAQGTPPSSGGLLLWDRQPTFVDTTRNRLVCIYDGHQDVPAVAPLMQFVDLSTGTLSRLNLSGALPVNFLQQPAAHDLDNDRYLLLDYWAMYAINPDTGVSTKLFDLPPSAQPQVDNIFTRGAYFQSVGAFVWAPYNTPNICVMATR